MRISKDMILMYLRRALYEGYVHKKHKMPVETKKKMICRPIMYCKELLCLSFNTLI